MPIYAYKCESCGYSKDVLQKISDPALTDCPSCGAARFQKQVTAAGFQLKGSGWYVTDFKGSSGAKAAAPGAADGATPAAAESTGAGASGAAASSETAAPAKAEAAATATPASKPSAS